jgi:hypothetical protein
VERSIKMRIITCKRGNAKQYVKDDHAFLGNMRFSGTCPAKILQPIKMNFARLIILDRLPHVPNMVEIGCLGAAHR